MSCLCYGCCKLHLHHWGHAIVLTGSFPILQQEWKNPDAVSDDAIDTVAAVMQESDMVEISEDGYQIRRKDVRLLHL